MKDLVYRLTYSTLFVYRLSTITVHKLFCGLQNIHKLLCGSYFSFQYPQVRFLCLPPACRSLGAGVATSSSAFSVVKAGGLI